MGGAVAVADDETVRTPSTDVTLARHAALNVTYRVRTSDSPSEVSWVTTRRSFDGPETAHRRAFGDAVRRNRRERGWTQEELAERADIHRSYLAALESGARNPTLDVIVRVANALHLPVAELFSRLRGQAANPDVSSG